MLGLILSIPIFLGLMMTPIEMECNCLVDILENMWRDERGFTSLAEEMSVSVSSETMTKTSGEMKDVLDASNFGINASSFEDWMDTGENAENGDPDMLLPVPVWKGLLFVTGHIAAATVKVGVLVYPIHVPLAFIILVLPIMGLQIHYIVLVPYVLVQEFVVPQVKKLKEIRK